MHALAQGPETWRLEIVDGGRQLLHGSGHAGRPEAEAAAAEWVRTHDQVEEGWAILVDDREGLDDVVAAAPLEGGLPLAWTDLEGYGAAGWQHLARGRG